MSKKQSKATKQANAERAAERAAELRRAQQARDRRRRAVLLTAAVVVALLVVGAIAYAVQSARDTTGEPATPPQGAVDTYALGRGQPDAPVTVEIYEDFMCPFCGQFEAAVGEQLVEYAAAGDVRVEYQMVAYLDRLSEGSDYSTRAMNAVAVVLDTAGPDAANELHDLLFENQPGEGTEGLSDDELIDLAVQAGAEKPAVRAAIEGRKFEQWVVNASDAASEAGYGQTPTVLVDGEEVEGDSIDDLAANTIEAIQDAG